KDILWIIELKAFYNPDNPRHIPTDLRDQSIIEIKLNELYTKSVHTLCMLETDRSNTQNCKTIRINRDTDFKLIHIISVYPGHEEYLSPMQDKLKDLLKPYLKIFRVSTCTILPYSLYRNSSLIPW